MNIIQWRLQISFPPSSICSCPSSDKQSWDAGPPFPPVSVAHTGLSLPSYMTRFPSLCMIMKAPPFPVELDSQTCFVVVTTKFPSACDEKAGVRNTSFHTSGSLRLLLHIIHCTVNVAVAALLFDLRKSPGYSWPGAVSLFKLISWGNISEINKLWQTIPTHSNAITKICF